jgi:lipopolysaccharide transport system ATP-binding protein
MLGVIGSNGAGKSTLLRLLGGIGRPTTGRIEVRGRVAALLDLGGGFLGDLTGRENAILAGVVAGLLRSEAIERLPEIVRFAEMEDFIDAPARTFSSGMMMRLAFSVSVHTDAEVLLVDEFLSVGDLAFQAKCRARIATMREGGCAIVMVSHSMDQVRDLCSSVLWLERGEVRASGSAETIAGYYEADMREKVLRRTANAPAKIIGPGLELRPRDNRLGSFEMEITDVKLRPGSNITSGDPLELEISFAANERIPSPIFSVSIVREDGTLCMDTNTQLAQVSLPEAQQSGHIIFRIERLELGAGSYFVNVGLFESNWNHAYDFHSEVYPLTVQGASAHKGVIAPKCRWRFEAPVSATMHELTGRL